MTDTQVETEARSGTPWTPGPWKAYFEDYGARPGIEADGSSFSVVIWGERYEETGVHGETTDQEAANAHLIAAAPDLAAAVAAYLDAFDAGTGTVYAEPQLRAALARARGEQS